ncbi:hypothetical protein D3C83_232170 [compost metagenome]
MAVDAPIRFLTDFLVDLRPRDLALPALGEELEARRHVHALHDLVLLGGAERAARGGEIGKA